MPRHEYNKLIRDLIPNLLEAQQIPFAVETMTTDEYRQALRQKLMEEAQEAAEAEEADLMVELADLLEVIEATVIAYGLERAQVVACQAQRQQERGGFSQQLRLLWTEVPA